MAYLCSIPPLLSLIAFFSLAGFVFFKGPGNKTIYLFTGICLLSGLLYLDILFAFNTSDGIFSLWVSRIDHLFIAFLVPLYIHFFHVYLSIAQPRWLIPTAYGMAVLLMGLAPTPWYIQSMKWHWFGYFASAGPLYSLFGVTGFFAAVYVFWRVYRALRSEKEPHRKKQLWFVFVGMWGLGILTALNFFPIHGISVYPLGNFGFIPLTVFAYGLFRHNLFNTVAFLHHSLVYSFTTACLTCLYALIVTIITKIFRDVDYSQSYLFSFLFFLFVALIFGPLKSRIQNIINQVFFRRAYDYQQIIKKLSQMIVTVLDLEKIGEILTQTVAEAMQAEVCRLIFIPAGGMGSYYFCYPKEHPISTTVVDHKNPLIQHLIKKKSSIAKDELINKAQDIKTRLLITEMELERAALVVPLVFKDHLNGYFLLGPKLSGELFNREDIDFLETLSDQSALAVENARSYKQVEVLNRDLEDKILARTAALKQTLLEKERVQEKLIQSESLAAIGQLVAGVAHELNNPLASTVSLLQTAIEDLEINELRSPPDQSTIDDLHYADQELRRARQIVTSLLDLSRQTVSYSESVSINAVIHDTLCVIQKRWKKSTFKLNLILGEKLPMIHGNFASLGQVAMNIIQNAFQAMEGKPSAVDIITRFNRNSNQVVFSCIDTGPGVPIPFQKDIFKPFFTTKDPGKGTGLGLYISHEIVRRHGGELLYSDHHGGGAEFTVLLPAHLAGSSE
jgi:signal transduction histidine kinase